MVDYTVGTGSAGKLIVRDNGSGVQAIVKNNSSSQTFANGKAWSVYLGNGGSASGTFNISGIQEVVVWSGSIGSTMSFQFNMGATGTIGLGGPTTLNCTIQRPTTPGAPVGLAWSDVGTSTAQINFNGPSTDGGSGIDYYLVRYGKSNPPENGTYVEFGTTTGANPRSGLDPGAIYYARVYTHNGIGYSAPSAVQAVQMNPNVPSAPTSYPWTNVGVTTAQINFAGSTSDGGASIDHYLVRYGKSNPPENGAYVEFQTVNGANAVGGLEPGATYYARVYTHNRAGYSASSAIQAASTLAPVRIKVGGAYRYAVPYVKVAGVYRMVQPYVKSAGVYRKTG